MCLTRNIPDSPLPTTPMNIKPHPLISGLALCATSIGLASCGGGGGNAGSKNGQVGSGTYAVGGKVRGLTTSAVTLQNNGKDDLTVNGNVTFSFTTQLATSSTYKVTIKQQPTGQTCVVFNSAGTIGTADVTDVDVACN
jgi:hypothetical protein